MTPVVFGRLIQGMNIYQNAKFALVIAESLRSHGPDKRDELDKFLTNLFHASRPYTDTKKFHENVWLINLTSEMRLLSEMMQMATRSGILSFPH